MNSVLQIFLNMIEIKNFFLNNYFKNCVNYDNTFGYKGKIVNEFLVLLKKKWKEEDCKVLTPRTWKEVIGKINEQFRAFDQQDAGDYLNFLIDVLHEEINLKSSKEFIPNPEFYNGERVELGSEYWANNLRRNISFIHSLFLGQLQNTLICQACGATKLSYETFLTLSLPIPQKKTIFLEIILHRLPFTFKAYFLKNEGRNQLNSIRKQSILQDAIDLEGYLSGKHGDDKKAKTLNPRKVSLKDSEEFNGSNTITKSQEKKGSKTSLNETGGNTHKNNVLSRLTCSIPLRLVIEFDRNKKVESIIDYLITEMKSLELEREQKYTMFFMGTSFNGKIDFISDRNMKIDDCFQNQQVIHIYEVLNTLGVNKLFKYSNESDLASHVNSKNVITLYINPLMFNNIKPSAPDIIEFLVPIQHRHPVKLDEFLFKAVGYCKLDTPSGYLIFSNKVLISLVII